MYLVGGLPTPLKNMNVNWDDEIPHIWRKKHKSCSSHHQPVVENPNMFATTNRQETITLQQSSATIAATRRILDDLHLQFVRLCPFALGRSNENISAPGLH